MAELRHRLKKDKTSKKLGMLKSWLALRNLGKSTAVDDSRESYFNISKYNSTTTKSATRTFAAFARFEGWMHPPSSTAQEEIASCTLPPADPVASATVSYISFVFHHLKNFLTALDKDVFGRCLREYYQGSKPADAPSFEPSIKLAHPSNTDWLPGDIGYANMAAPIEVRASSSPQAIDDALEALINKMRKTAWCQPSRHFALGVAVCGNEVRICLMMNGVVFVSSAIDVTTDFGRQQFTNMLVNMSLCDKERLGFDIPRVSHTIRGEASESSYSRASKSRADHPRQPSHQQSGH
ncbi:hypothetical protein FBU59_003565 [Linderina macrospora]|uniref:Uncharacterized protein n=1 Tax=Linderina macrospora TaxID=4868 RepID=A0ACC1J838_9FUNG|nr:hypothetical protein FBU59_003565 [Linderina macrospora]